MSKKGPILLIEDDHHYLDVIKEALADNGVKNPVIIFNNAHDAKTYLLNTAEQPFIILCDIRMARMNGLELRDVINDNEYLRKKSIPFLFLTAAVSQEIVNEAYDLTVQGFIPKPKTYEDLKETLKSIVGYWNTCLHPNCF